MTTSHPASGSILVTGVRAAALRAFPTTEIVEGDLLKPETLRGPWDGY